MLNHLPFANTLTVIFVFPKSILSLLHGWVVLSKTVAFCELAHFAHVSKMFLLLYLWWTIFLANEHQTDSSFKSYKEQFFLFWIFGVGVYVILATDGAAIFIHVYFTPITEQSLDTPLHLLFYALLTSSWLVYGLEERFDLNSEISALVRMHTFRGFLGISLSLNINSCYFFYCNQFYDFQLQQQY